MVQEIKATNISDDNGNPTGGSVEGVGIKINWQDGPLGDGIKTPKSLPNGAFVDDVILSAIQRLEYFQDSKFKCRENALAITKLEEALHWLNHRRANREKRKVEGTHSV